MCAVVSQNTYYAVSGNFKLRMCSSNLAFPQSQNNSIAFSVSEKAFLQLDFKAPVSIYMQERLF